MRNCNMPNCNMPRYDMPRMGSTMPRMNSDMPRHMSGDMSCDCNRDMERYMHERERENSCECDDYPIGMAYVPWQEFKDLHDTERGMHAGTIFMELDKPFTGRRSMKR